MFSEMKWFPDERVVFFVCVCVRGGGGRVVAWKEMQKICRKREGGFPPPPPPMGLI